jgi:hypothetical protein
MVETVEELRAVLVAYRQVKDASWPRLHTGMADAAGRWDRASEDQLRREIRGYLDETAAPGGNVRVFWKTGTNLAFAGCNERFASDAGLTARELIGLDDFSEKVPWAAQAAKYRADDKEVVDSGQPKLDILERQSSATGVVWVLVGKAPIRVGDRSIGILGMYEVLDKEAANKLFAKRTIEGR